MQPGDSIGERALLCAESVSFSWRGRPVLRGVSLGLEPGDVVALGGGNGTGKTTLLRLLAGALEPEAGTVRRGGPASARTSLGWVGAGDRGLYARLDARANLELAVALALAPRVSRRRLITSALERFELAPLARHRVDRLSTGQRQRVRLAIAFAADPQVVLLDEPAGGLDEAGVTLLAAALEAAAARGAAAMWAAPGTPDARPALPAGRAYSLVDGRLGPD